MACELTISTSTHEAAQHALTLLRLDMVAAQSRENIVRLDQGEKSEWYVQTVVASQELCLESFAKWAAMEVGEFSVPRPETARFCELDNPDDEHASCDSRESTNLWVGPVWPDYSPIVNGDDGKPIAIQHLGITEKSVNEHGEHAWLWFSERLREWMQVHDLASRIVWESGDLRDSRSLSGKPEPEWPAKAIANFVAYVDHMGESIAEDLTRVSGRRIGYTDLRSNIS